MANWNLAAFNRRDLIRLTLEVSAAMTRNPHHLIHLADLPIWMEALGVDYLLVGLSKDGRVEVTASASYRGQYTTVFTTADMLRDMDLPPFDPELPWNSVRLELADMGRLEDLRAVAS